MFKPTAPLFRRLRRLALTTKMVNKGFYKGNRVGSLGHLDHHGRFRVDWDKVRTFVPPEKIDLAKDGLEAYEKFDLTPFVPKQKVPEDTRYMTDEEMEDHKDTLAREEPTGQNYLDAWKIKGYENTSSLPGR